MANEMKQWLSRVVTGDDFISAAILVVDHGAYFNRVSSNSVF